MARVSTSSTNRHSRLQSRHSSNVNAYLLGQPLSAEERHRRIAEAAYLIAERRGFQGGSALEDWLTAEAKIDALSAPAGPKRYTKEHIQGRAGD